MGARKANGFTFPSLTLWVRLIVADFRARPDTLSLRVGSLCTAPSVRRVRKNVAAR